MIQEQITNDINNIVERWYELDDVGYIPENEKFLFLQLNYQNWML